MTINYKVEAISTADTERLTADCLADARLQSDIVYSARNGLLSKCWAIDDAHEGYLLVLSEIVREDSGKTWYPFRWRGILVRFATLAPFGTIDGDPILFSKPLEMSQPELSGFLVDLASAFAAHGRYGEGVQNDFSDGDRVRPIAVAKRNNDQ
jgi:hypothetical protein